MKSFSRIALLLAVVTFAGANSASADTLLSFNLTGPVNATFELPANPVPSDVDPGFGFVVQPIDLMINGLPSSDFLAFYAPAGGGAFGAFFDGFTFDFLLSGPQLYSGDEGAPLFFVPADQPMDLLDFDSGTDGYRLTIGTFSTTEPTSLLLLAVALVPLVLLAKRLR